ncbi:CAP domain-containing protein [Chitinophaga sp.]|uniref:CAP domain-containing protein n=1 Tax=Chitinophaga sp. TaxID=1869181 RepID=UPI0031D9D43D
MFDKLNRFTPFALLMLATACTKEAPVQPQPEPEEPGTVVVIENNVNKDLLLHMVNEVRAQGCNCGSTVMPPVQPVSWNILLELAAAKHSKDMVERKYFSHNSPDGTTPQTRITAAGYKYSWSGENIASGFSREADVISGWLKSEGHCKNLMSANYKEMGIGRANGVWTQVFAAPSGK